MIMRTLRGAAVLSVVLLLTLWLTIEGRAESAVPADPGATPRIDKSGTPFATIASGEVGGLFFPVAGAICRAYVQTRARDGSQPVHCVVEPTAGSLDNLSALGEREVEFGLAHSDAVRKAWDGDAPFPRAMKSLRSVVTLYTESFTLAVSAKSGVKSLEDLKGKGGVWGVSDPTLERAARELLTACGFKAEEVSFRALAPGAMQTALRNREIQAQLFVVGHPDERVWNLASAEPLTLIPLTGACLEPLLARSRHYVKAVVPGGLYPGIEQETPTLGLRATLMASADTPEDLVHAVTRAVVEKLYRFRGTPGEVETPEPKSLFEGLVAPLHLGAFRYFQEMRVLEFKKTGVDILSGLPGVIERSGVLHPLEINARAGAALRALRPPLVAPGDGDAGLPLTLATSPAAAKSGSAHWLMLEPVRNPG